jgi:hypothetical protein
MASIQSRQHRALKQLHIQSIDVNIVAINANHPAGTCNASAISLAGV